MSSRTVTCPSPGSIRASWPDLRASAKETVRSPVQLPSEARVSRSTVTSRVQSEAVAGKLYSPGRVGVSVSSDAPPATLKIAVTGKSRKQASSATGGPLSGCGSRRSLIVKTSPSSVTWLPGPTTASTARSSSSMVSVTVPIAAPSAVTSKVTVSVSSSLASSTIVIGKATLFAPVSSVPVPLWRVQSSLSTAVGVPEAATAITRAAPDVPPPATATVSVTVASSPSTAVAFESANSSPDNPSTVPLVTRGHGACPGGEVRYFIGRYRPVFERRPPMAWYRPAPPRRPRARPARRRSPRPGSTPSSSPTPRASAVAMRVTAGPATATPLTVWPETVLPLRVTVTMNPPGAAGTEPSSSGSSKVTVSVAPSIRTRSTHPRRGLRRVRGHRYVERVAAREAIGGVAHCVADLRACAGRGVFQRDVLGAVGDPLCDGPA